MPSKKSKRLVDVLGEEKWNHATGEFLKVATDKFVKLFYLIKHQNKTGNDVPEYKWCQMMVDKVAGGMIPTKEELAKANRIWRQYK